MSRVVGIDFDNTIIDYGDAFYRVAVEEGLLPALDQTADKPRIRQLVRELPDGEAKWQLVQSLVYSRELVHAQLYDGVANFLRRCTQHSVTVYIISHKTEFPHSPAVPVVNLREAAFRWLEEQQVTDPASGYYVPQGQVSFHATREEKLAAIRHRRCDYYIDDLPEVLTDSRFPAPARRILFDPQGRVLAPETATCSSWQEISQLVFGAV